MAKLTVKNVGPIREAELEVKKYTVFIGPQGSGKSTLAKLIAIGSDILLLTSYEHTSKNILQNFGLLSYCNKNSYFAFRSDLHETIFKKPHIIDILLSNGNNYISYKEAQKISNKEKKEIKNLASEYISKIMAEANKEYIINKENNIIEKNLIIEQSINRIVENGKYFASTFQKLTSEQILKYVSTYIPSERHVFPILSDAVWSLISANINLPEFLKSFGGVFEYTRNENNSLVIPFLNITYSHENGRDLVYYTSRKSLPLAQSASGHQSIIPLLLVIEYQRLQFNRRFIIEEPELNLYPTTQKDLIYNLIGGLQPDVEYKDAEWVFTTHSPYILTSLNTLMLAYKVAQRSDELKEEVKKIVPERCWINPDEFAAYYVDNGTVESITNPDTGLINDSRLDDVSEDFAGEQDKLFELYRTAFVND